MKAYYGSRIGENRTKTPEGFLICHNTPIARVGWQDYLPHELGLEGEDFVKVLRAEEDVFEPAAMASFEGKPVTDDHPRESEDVLPENIGRYLRGVATNVRRGCGEEMDLLLADLIIYDPILIAEIESGKRETSCGYNYKLAPLESGGYAQKMIRGNHVAIVRNGRAGPRIRVKDEKPKKEGGKNMSKIDKNTIWGKMLGAFAKDAEPEELAEASKMMQEKTSDTELLTAAPVSAPPAADPKPSKDEDPGAAALQGILETVKAMQADIAALKAGAAQDEEPTQALDELEKELAQDDEPAKEETATIEDDAPVAPTESLPENPIPGADSKAAILAALKAVRPIVAQIPDPAERKKAADAMVKSFREQLQVQPTNNYRKMARPPKPKKTQDSAMDERELGRRWAKKWNPHYKNRE